MLGGTNIFNGPLIQGDAPGAQLAWNSTSVTQVRNETVAPGYEALAELLAETLERLPDLGLSAEEKGHASEATQEALAEVTSANPDKSRMRRSLMVLKGSLSHLAAGLVIGSEEGMVDWARTAVEHLHLP